MAGDLIDAFDFCVYDSRKRRHLLRLGPIYRHLDREPWLFASWLTAPKGLPNVTPGSVLLQYPHPALSYRSPTQEDRSRLGYQFGMVFCLFLQGVVLGWETIEHGVLVAGARRDEIDVNRHLGELTIEDFLLHFQLDNVGVRTACREDLLTFAVQQYRERGAGQEWALNQFVNSGLARFPYDADLAGGVLDDLMQERVLDGVFGGSTWLLPERAELEYEKSRKSLEAWLETVREVGKRERWIGMTKRDDQQSEPPKDPRKVFVVHGRNGRARGAMFQFLRAIGLSPLEWSEAVELTGTPTPYVGTVLDAAFAFASAVVVLMTPEDEARLREEFITDDDGPHERDLTPQARANVLFEAGMAMGRNADRTVLVEIGQLRPFSDIGGRHVIRMNNTTERRQEFARRLRLAGCPINLNGTDWHTAGDFT